MISVELILFWLSQKWPVTLRIQEYVFSGCPVPPDNKEIEIWSSNQEASPLVSKNNEVVLVSCCAWKCVPTAISITANYDHIIKRINEIVLNHKTFENFALWIFEAFVLILFIVNLPLNQTLLKFWLYVRQAWMTLLILVISMWWVIVRKDSTTHMHGLAVYVKEGLPFVRENSRKLWGFLLMFLIGFTSFSVLLLFLLSITFFVFMHCFWYFI